MERDSEYPILANILRLQGGDMKKNQRSKKTEREAFAVITPKGAAIIEENKNIKVINYKLYKKGDKVDVDRTAKKMAESILEALGLEKKGHS